MDDTARSERTGERSIFRPKRNPAIAFRHHGRLAGDRIAKDREAVRRPDEEGVEAVEIVEAALERFLERGALA